MNVGRPVRITATGDVPGAARGGTVYGLSITPGTADTTITIRQGGAAGTILFVLKAQANDPSFGTEGGWRFEGQLHVTVAGADAELTVMI